MALFNVREMRAGLAPGQRLIGLDPGAKVIGVALSDATCLLATPWGSVKRGKLAAVADALRRIGAAEGVGGLVVGWPLSMDGTMGPAAQAVTARTIPSRAESNANRRKRESEIFTFIICT